MLTPRRFALTLATYLLPCLAVACLAPFVGSAATTPEIFWMLRLPRVVLGFLAGGTLALAGAALQVVLRNPLAEPYTLGVASGGALGAVIAIMLPGLAVTLGPLSSVQLFSLAGCGLALGLIYALARRPQGVSMSMLLLAGVTIGILCGALILLVRFLAKPTILVAMERWVMGGLDVFGYRDLAALLPFLLPGLGLLVMQIPSLNHLSLGEEMAAGHGVDVAAVHREVFLGAGLATAAVVSVTGPIGFVGLIVPHTVRRLSGFDHRIVLPASFLLGGAFLVACDAAARVVVAPAEMPAGILTALVGGPIFIRILLRRR
ncbi:MAG: iron ABC transporter permease [Planctomycetes bacterium]|nr:iron ABC transporter permease [Planctomycetota bacterium]